MKNVKIVSLVLLTLVLSSTSAVFSLSEAAAALVRLKYQEQAANLFENDAQDLKAYLKSVSGSNKLEIEKAAKALNALLDARQKLVDLGMVKASGSSDGKVQEISGVAQINAATRAANAAKMVQIKAERTAQVSVAKGKFDAAKRNFKGLYKLFRMEH